jgi:hypothetical protein
MEPDGGEGSQEGCPPRSDSHPERQNFPEPEIRQVKSRRGHDEKRPRVNCIEKRGREAENKPEEYRLSLEHKVEKDGWDEEEGDEGIFGPGNI